MRMEAGKGFVALGLEPPASLAAFTKEDVEGQDLKQVADELSPGDVMLQPGEKIIGINGQSVSADSQTDFAKLDQASQQFGKPVDITISSPDGKTRTATFQPHLLPPFSGPLQLAGIARRMRGWHKSPRNPPPETS